MEVFKHEMKEPKKKVSFIERFGISKLDAGYACKVSGDEIAGMNIPAIRSNTGAYAKLTGKKFSIKKDGDGLIFFRIK